MPKSPKSNITFPANVASSPPELFFSQGEMKDLMHSHDWTKSELGPIEQWPTTLITTVNIILESRFPYIIFWGPNFNMIYNDSYIPILGAKHPAALGKAAVEAWDEIWDFIKPMFDRVLHGEATWSNDQLLFLKRNGYLEECYFTWSYSPIRDEKGNVAGISAPVWETTRRVLSERRLSTSRELGSKTVNVSSLEEACAISANVLSENSTDIPFAFIYLLNSADKKLSLKSMSGFKGINAKAPEKVDLTANEDISIFFQQVLENKNIIELADPQSYFGELPDGQWLEPPTLAVAVTLPSSDLESPAGILIVGINTRRAYDEDYQGFIELVSGQIAKAIAMGKAYEQERKRIEELDKLNQAKTIFFSNISHEFRTPLALMLGPLADSLVDIEHPLPAHQRERQLMIQRNALRLLKLVNSLLDFSRIEAGRAQAWYTPIDLANFTKELSCLFESLIATAGLKFNLNIDKLEESAYVDSTMWEKIVLNLLSNAFKFTLQGSITVSLKQLQNNVILRVSDTGTGIPKEELPLLFQRFHRIEGAQGRSYEGSGIGLALVHELVKLHGGTINVESTVNEGSTFIITIPLGKSHLPPEQVKEQAAPSLALTLGNAYIQEAQQWLASEDSTLFSAIDSGNDLPTQFTSGDRHSELMPPQGRVLLVDDNADMRAYITSILAKYWEVETANDGKAALELACLSQPDLIISDVMMPLMDGFELINHLRDNPVTNKIPVILLSARAGEEAKVEGFHKGADDYIVKTAFSAQELVARVKIHLELAQLRSNLEKKIEERTAELSQVNQKLQAEIVERTNIEKALKASEERSRLINSLVPVGISHHDKDGVCTYANPALCQIFGLDVEGISQWKWMDMLHEEDQERVIQQWQNYIQRKDQAIFQSTYRIRSPQGEIQWLYGQAISQYDSEHQITGFVTAITDITKEKQLEHERLQALASAEEHQRLLAHEAEANKQKQKEFVDTICHEIRNPLNGITGNIELLKAQLKTIRSLLAEESADAIKAYLIQHLPNLDEHTNSIEECAMHQASITNDVLDLSKLEVGKATLFEAPFKPKQVIIKVVDMYKAEIAKKKLNIILDSIDDIAVKGDASKVKQVLINLLTNAIKFTPEGGLIKIELKSHLKTPPIIDLQFTVQDTGIGMDEAELATIFARYSQANKSIGSKFGGSGLGLTICSKLVELLGGTIQVESQKGKGTAFSFTIKCKPLQLQESFFFKQDIEHKQISSPLLSSKSPKDITILIVEDNEINQRLLSRFLEKRGYHIVTANDGQEAVELFALKKFDLIFMDLIMPRMNGFEATRRIRAQEKSQEFLNFTPIIGLSANSVDEYLLQAKEAGMNDFISKPVKSESIYALIDKWISVHNVEDPAQRSAFSPTASKS